MGNLNLQGIDVSSHQLNTNWDVAHAAGLDFAMVKVSQANNYVNPQFIRDRDACRRLGMAVGGYHFYRWDVDPVLQAQWFISKLGQVLPGDLPPCVDLENVGDGAGPINFNRAEAIRRAGVFMDLVDKATGRVCMIYSYPSMWRDVLGNPTVFHDRPLWVASYNAGPPTLFGGWQEYALRQTTSTGHVSGVQGIVDLNVFTGTQEEWSALTGAAQPQPQSEKSVYFAQTGKVVKTGFLDYFQAHGDVPIFGYPIRNEEAGTNGSWSGTVQWFERACMEWHTESGQGVVMLRNLGTEAAPKGV